VSGADREWLRLHRVALAEFDLRVRQIPPDHWGASTPCEEWDVYDLVRHNTVENRWVAPLLTGTSLSDARYAVEAGGPDGDGPRSDEADSDETDGDELDGDYLETDPTDDWEESRLEALAAFDGADLGGQVELAEEPTSVVDYLCERVSDLTVHAWDLARAIGVDESLDDELVAAVWEHWWPRRDALARSPARFEHSLEPPLDVDLQTRLLALFGREA
jgi:uncharacterized protein (TIGR03086 family)